MEWYKYLVYDPLKPLTNSGENVVSYFARRDLLEENVPSVSAIWSGKKPQSILKKQKPGGYWVYPGKSEDHYLLATFKNLQTLVYQYEFNRTHPAVAGACEFLFSYQTEEGDIRGFLGNQYAPYYTGIVVALLIKAGFEDDPPY